MSSVTLRDDLALQAIQVIINDCESAESMPSPEEVAALAYCIADAMISVRDKRNADDDILPQGFAERVNKKVEEAIKAAAAESDSVDHVCTTDCEYKAVALSAARFYAESASKVMESKLVLSGADVESYASVRDDEGNIVAKITSHITFAKNKPTGVPNVKH